MPLQKTLKPSLPSYVLLVLPITNTWVLVTPKVKTFRLKLSIVKSLNT